ncbi:AP2/ERF family transcription factor [Phaeovulum vinaykumarii]|uniref:AP2/ERF domain-containing protein n=1 Tax=Phaeovulum vinaykumarii TaxID=407234 RepID=A0A1N7MZK2_9RHOB|nr:hypothetical protein [Phaeovulum vinaykumarii]SIS91515.1 hypothetical protein SAMN05421795_11228 [Phaeovulum vinaykumarii]SOC17545.1 hypothetical protein SAMN05878426_11228 [Phaeovulum vinaykumarii]
MQSPVENTRAAVQTLIQSLDPALIALVATSRDLEAIVDKRFDRQVRAHRWYAVISRGDHIHAAANIDGRRISLQRYVMKLQYPERTYEELKQVSFENKITFDCRISNLDHLVGRQAVMRNRRPKRNTSSQYKGVTKALGPDGSPRWRTQIMTEHGSMGIGVYDDEHWAATVYDAAASLLFEGQARYNFPGKSPDQDALLIAATKIARYRAKAKHRKGAAVRQEIPVEV